MAEATDLRGQIDCLLQSKHGDRASGFAKRPGHSKDGFSSADTDPHDQEEHVLRQRLSYVENILNSCDVCPVPESCEEIRIGHLVNAKRVDNNAGPDETLTFYMAGEGEGDAPSNPPRYSYQSPFANRFLGKGVGDVVSARVRGEVREYEITKISIPESSQIEWPLARIAS